MIIIRRKLTESEKFVIYKRIDSSRDRFITQARTRFLKDLNDKLKIILQAIKEYRDLDLKIFEKSNPIQKSFVDQYKFVGTHFAKQTSSQIEAQQTVKQDNQLIDQWAIFMQDFALKEAGARITNINLNSLDIVRKVLNKGITEGLGIQEIGRNIRKRWNEINKYRAERIARTEIISASNRGSLLGAESTGLGVKKTWLSTRDRRTRDAHIGTDGQSVELYSKFNVFGELMSYPGDPAGSAGNVINCRCTVIYEGI